ncbi:MAG TPA: Rrf2 family transcriptional regulator [Saprospiraceae bacterium]|nr:Rrf2 family transcriptional regulator [Saprospiraceae bacterium]
MLSKTCEYALRAMIYVAQHSREGEMINIKEIAAKINSPELFIGKILQGLSKKGFLLSSKGRYGGFYIDDKAARNSLADIVIAIDGDKVFKGCGLGLDYCSSKNPCPVHHEYKKVRDEMYKVYRETKLSKFRAENCTGAVLKRI